MKNILIVFVKNLIEGKVKSRLAKTIGKNRSLSVYKKLLVRTREIVWNLSMNKQICYSDVVINNDIWEEKIFQKSLQSGNNLGLRMLNAFKDASNDGYENMCLIGSDSMELTDVIINSAFELLEKHDIVLGPSVDGGYYLICMSSPTKNVFKNITWSTELVLKQTIDEIQKLNLSYVLLPTLNDIDEINDINDDDKEYLFS